MALNNLIDNSVEFCIFCFIHNIMVIDPQYRTVGGNFNNVQLVNFHKFIRFSRGCTSHAGQLVIHTEKVLEGNCC